MIEVIKRYLPWWAKIGAKLALSRVPAAYTVWQRLGLFRHGYMDTAQYAIGVFSSHIQRAGLTNQLVGKTVLEVGPGDSVATALIAKAYGARALLVDAGSYAQLDLSVYHRLADELRAVGLAPPSLDNVSSLGELLETCEASYLTEGLASLRTLGDATVDFAFSQAVLEHVRKHEFLDTQRELGRILKPGGMCSHRVDLRDHLGGGLNNLRFSSQVWESPFFFKSGFYTNRIRFSEMVSLFQQAGFAVEITETQHWDKLPIDRRHLAAEFCGIPEEVLIVSGFDALLRRTHLSTTALHSGFNSCAD
ncbi:MAG: class I SAM-dependent methyltransferase [Rugosibacter sp.]|jgi:SAM-dependent methyltransferase